MGAGWWWWMVCVCTLISCLFCALALVRMRVENLQVQRHDGETLARNNERRIMRGLCSLMLLLLLLCTFSGRAELSTDCGVAGWPVPDPPSGAKLLQVHAITRHGDRTPWTGDSCWPNDTAVWTCSLNSAQVPMYSDTQYGPVVPRLYRKVFDFGGEALMGNCSVGQLTTIGFNQQQLNGGYLRKAYVDTGFLNSTISPSEIYLRSDDEPRTLQSAEALMLGMYPPTASSTEVVQLHTLDTTYDYITANADLCPKFGEYQAEFWSSSVWCDHQNVTKTVLNDLSNVLNFPVGEGDLNHICDCLRTYHCHDLPWPRGMTSKLYELAWQELSWQFFSQFAYPSVQATAQVGIGFLMREIWQNMNMSVENQPIEKFLLYSGHDTTLIPILVALQVDTMEWPPYASLMLMELFDQAGKRYVRVTYNGQVLSLSFCGSQTLCDYETFSNYLKSITPSDPGLQCQV